jgi:hypothetical protein
MPDHGPHDDDLAWLLARERGEPAPTISEARASRYAQLGTLIADLPATPAGTVEHEGWEQDVLAAIDAEASRPACQSTSPTVTDEPLPKAPPAATRHRRRMATAAAVFAMAASVALVVFMRRAPGTTDEVDPGGSGSQRPPDVTRGMHVEPGRLAFDHAVEVRRSNSGVALELRDGDTVMTGDRIRVSVRTSADAYLYLAFCASQHLQIYPSQHGLRITAGDLVLVPDGGGELVLDSQPGSEVLYLIVSRDELSHADPDLAALIAAIGDGTKAVDCGASLDRLMKPTGAVVTEPRGIAVVRYRFTHVAPENVDDPTKASEH